MWGWPMAATTMSERLSSAAMSFVREWHTTTVASMPLSDNRLANTRPTVGPRPAMPTTAPDSGIPYRVSSSRMPAGVADTKPGLPSISLPMLTGLMPSTSFSALELTSAGSGFIALATTEPFNNSGMAEVPPPGEDHGHAEMVGGGDDIVVLGRPSRLHDGHGAGFGARLHAIGKREQGLAGR